MLSLGHSRLVHRVTLHDRCMQQPQNMHMEGVAWRTRIVLEQQNRSIWATAF